MRVVWPAITQPYSKGVSMGEVDVSGGHLEPS